MNIRQSGAVVVGLILAIVVLRPARPETASPTLAQVAAQVAALQTTVTTLQATVSTQTGQITALEATVNTQAGQITALQTTVGNLQSVQADLQSKLQFVSVSGNEMYITGANLNIRNGVGRTDGANGIGNLIVGYNENASEFPRTGSHNIVVGSHHGYLSYGGFVAGFANVISGTFASISGGQNNQALDHAASVSGGLGNVATISYASVSGGQSNTASGQYSSVSGGSGNTASAPSASVSGGNANIASGTFASISGGVLITQAVQFGWAAGTFIWP